MRKVLVVSRAGAAGRLVLLVKLLSVVLLAVMVGNAAAATPGRVGVIPPYASANVVELMKTSQFRVNGKDYVRLQAKLSGPDATVVSGVPTLTIDISKATHPMFRVLYRNALASPAIMHAHGLTPPGNLDGVPYLSALPIAADREQLYVYELLPQNVGTYFIHSHYGFQHEQGLAFPLVIKAPLPAAYPLATAIDKAKDVVLYLEDFCPYQSDNPDQNPSCFDSMAVYNTLKAGWAAGAATFDFSNCMAPGTDTDVKYRAQLANYKTLDNPVTVRVDAGEMIRLRIINSAGMSHYWVDFGALADVATIISVDGQLVKPVTGQAGVWVAVAQRADVTFRLAAGTKGVFPIIAQLEQLPSRPTQQSGIVLLVGGADAPARGAYNVTTPSGPGYMAVQTEQLLHAFEPLPSAADVSAANSFAVNLTGDNGFSSINTKSFQLPPLIDTFASNPHPLLVTGGGTYCLDFTNFNADSHAMHLHGHSFQVTGLLNKTITDGAVRDTVLVPKGACNKVRVCFKADNPAQEGWPLHCHMNQHLAAGMLTTVEYQKGTSLPPARSKDHAPSDGNVGGNSAAVPAGRLFWQVMLLAIFSTALLSVSRY